MENLTANQTAVLKTLTAEVESHYDRMPAPEGKVWGSVYLPNCRGFGSREFAGTLGTLEKLGLYKSQDQTFGMVLVNAR